MNLKMGLMAVSAMTAVSAMPAQAADLLGNTVNCFRNGVACSNVATATVGAGAEFDRGSSLYDFTATGLNVTTSNSLSFVDPLVYSFTNSTAAFTGFSNLVITGTTAFNASRVTLTNGVLAIDFSGVGPGAGLSLNLTTAVAAVPETATWGMMIAGFGMMGAAMRTRRRSAKVSFA